MQKSICEANFAWIFACYWNGVNSNLVPIFPVFLIAKLYGIFQWTDPYEGSKP